MVDGPLADPRPVPTIVLDLDAEIAARERVASGLRAELARVEGEVARLRTARSAIHPEGAPGGGTGNDGTSDAAQGGRKGKPGSDADLIRAFAAEAIPRAGRPLNRAEILVAMREAGISLSSKYPALRIGKALWKSSAFKSVKDGYWLAALPLPAADPRD